MASIEVFGVEHIDLTVRELVRSEEYYGKVLSALGFRRLEEHPDPRWANAYMTIGLRPSHEKDASHDRYHPGLHHLAFKAHAREDVDEFHRFLLREHLPVLDPPKEYPEYGETYYAVFFTDPDGMKLELAHFPWGYWRRAQIDSADDRPRYQRKSS